MERRLRQRRTSASLDSCQMHSSTDAAVASELLHLQECAPRRRRSTISIDTSWGHVYNRLFTSDTASTASSMEFAAEYNTLAKKHGLLSLSGADDEPYEKDTRRRWFRRIKKPTTYPLNNFARLSGCSVLTLPVEHTVGPLVVPSCFAAMGALLLREGRTIGIFRIPGAASSVNDICEHYLQQLRNDSAIDTTVTTQAYPPRLSQSIHDVASAFKKLLSKITGGILGSTELFHALDDCVRLNGNPELSLPAQRDTQLKLLALALLSRDQHYRASLICAVFGLLSVIAGETEKLAGPQMMNARSLSVVFGPLLLGEQLNEISIQNRSLIEPPSAKLQQTAFMALHIERLKRAATIAETLILNWKGIIRQIRLLNEPRHSIKLVEDESLAERISVSKRSRSSTEPGLAPVHEAVTIPDRGPSLNVKMSGPVLQHRDGSLSGVAVFSVDKPLLETSNKNTAMHAEVRRLQSLLSQKTDECTQLRREAEALRSKKVLPELRKELDTWRQRAEAAEKRVLFLEKPRR